jgi:ribosomal protein S6
VSKYEVIIILDERKIDDSGQKFIGEFTKAVEELGGKIGETVDMGRNQLAYPINKRYTGRYWNLDMELDKEQVAELHKRFKLNNTVMRLAVYNDERPEGEGRAQAAPPPRKRAVVKPGNVTKVEVTPAEEPAAEAADAEKPAVPAAEEPAAEASAADEPAAEEAAAEEPAEAAAAE